jgi:hypothetical protein
MCQKCYAMNKFANLLDVVQFWNILLVTEQTAFLPRICVYEQILYLDIHCTRFNNV